MDISCSLEDFVRLMFDRESVLQAQLCDDANKI